MSPGNPPGAVEVTARIAAGSPPAATVNVCHVASGDRWAGAEVQIATLLRHLRQHETLALSAIVLNAGRLAEEIRNAGIEVKVIREDERNFLAIYREATYFLRGKNIRVLHSHRYKENLLAALVARRCRIPVVVRTQHGLTEPVRGLKRIKHGLIQGLDHIVARRATDRVISVSSEMTSSLAQRLGAGKIVTIPNGIDRTTVQSRLTPQDAKARLGIPKSSHVIGAAGRLERVKRLDIFVTMAAHICRVRPDTIFVLVGDGREERKLKDLAETLGVQDRVLFLGHRNDIYDVMQAFDLLLFTSDHEGLPMALLEAMALGAVVVARAVGGIPEVIQDGTSGSLVDSNDPRVLAEACLRVLSNPVQRQQMATAARSSLLQDYTAENTASRVKQVYDSLLGRP